MLKFKEDYLCKAMDVFKEMITHGECSKQDIMYFYDLSRYELNRRGASIDKKRWLTKQESSMLLGVSTSTFDRVVSRGLLPKGKKLQHQKSLVWNADEVEQLKYQMLLKTNT